MNLTINGTARDVALDPGASLDDLLGLLGITQRRGVAVAIDDAVVPRSTWPEHTVRDGDRVEIIKATQGG